MSQFTFRDQIVSFEDYMDTYLKNKSTDCILYSEDGSKFKVHKELFGQTDFLRKILSSTKDHCCGIIEVICPCSKDELRSLVNFLYDGEIHCKKESESLKIIENLQNVFGFQRNLDFKHGSDEIETIAQTDAEKKSKARNVQKKSKCDKVFENIHEDPNAEKIVIIPLRSKDLSGKLVTSGQGKEDYVLHNGEKKSKKISSKGSSMKKYPKQFNCNNCAASFILKSKLQRHINAVHLNLKPYECDHCQMSFAQKSDIQKHINAVHLKLKPFECDQCQKSFSLKGQLKNHINAIHLKIKPYESDQCKKSFSQKSQLITHVHQQIKSHKYI